MSYTMIEVPKPVHNRLKVLSAASGIRLKDIIEKTLPAIEKHLAELSLIEESEGKGESVLSEDTEVHPDTQPAA